MKRKSARALRTHSDFNTIIIYDSVVVFSIRLIDVVFVDVNGRAAGLKPCSKLN